MKLKLAVFLIVLSMQANGQVVLASRTVRAQQVLTFEDLKIVEGEIDQGVSDPELLVGREARTALYSGRPIRLADTRPPALVERNAPVHLHYVSSGLTIITDGRSLDRAAAGEWIRVMNIASRTTVTAFIGADGAAYVRP